MWFGACFVDGLMIFVLSQAVLGICSLVEVVVTLTDNFSPGHTEGRKLALGRENQP